MHQGSSEPALGFRRSLANIVEDGLCDATPFISDVLGIFPSITILGNAHRPCLHLLSLHNNLTTKVYIVQKKPCDLDHNWQRYIETFIFAKNDD